MSTEAKRAGNARHMAKLDNINIRPYKDEGERIRAAAEAGQSVNSYIKKRRGETPPFWRIGEDFERKKALVNITTDQGAATAAPFCYG